MNTRKKSYRLGVRRLCASVVSAGMMALAACSTLDVETIPAPGANLEGRSTFRIVERPPSDDSLRQNPLANGHTGGPVVERAVTDAMLNNSIVDREVREQIVRAFESRGYRMSETNPAIEVSFFAGAVEREDFDSCYGYPYGWGDSCGYPASYTEGMVLIDVRDPLSGELLWRGSGEALVSDEPEEYVEQLNRAIRKIVGRYPRVSPRYAEALQDGR